MSKCEKIKIISLFILSFMHDESYRVLIYFDKAYQPDPNFKQLIASIVCLVSQMAQISNGFEGRRLEPSHFLIFLFIGGLETSSA